MLSDNLGCVIKVTGGNVLIKVLTESSVHNVNIKEFSLNYVSVGSLIGTKLLDGRTLVLLVDEILENDSGIFISTFISGIFDEVTQLFTFGTNKYPLVGENVFRLGNDVLLHILNPQKSGGLSIGTYLYDNSVQVGCDPNILFGKHLGVFGNTGSGKTCTIVSIIQNYISMYPEKDIKFIILDVNGEYKSAFTEDTAEFIEFNRLRFHHSTLSNPEYGRLCRASEGVQYPALKDCIESMSTNHSVKWNMLDLPKSLNKWILDNSYPDKNGNKELFSKNQLSGYLRSMQLRLESIINDIDLMAVINSAEEEETIDSILSTSKKVIILDLQVSNDCLDIVVYLFFKSIYARKSTTNISTHFALVLEEAHRYINVNVDETKLGNYYIDKISREGRKFGIGLIISSQIPSMLQYEVVSQCNSVIMHKITNKRDLDFLRGVLRVSNDIFYLQMSALEKQYAIVCGEAFPSDTVVRVNRAFPLPRSNDPEIQDIIFPLVESDNNVFFDFIEQPISSCNKELGETEKLEELNNQDKLIAQLKSSPNFLTTHVIIAKLAKFDNWTLDQYHGLCEALIKNNQVNWVKNDPDVKSFYRKTLNNINKLKNSLDIHYGVLGSISSACELIFDNS
jgi:DNA helicase HerA-like ATPase